MNLGVKPFTLVGATTRYGLVSEPPRSRFGSIHRMDFYDDAAMRTLLERTSRSVGGRLNLHFPQRWP